MLTFTQTNTAAPAGTIQACSATAVGGTPKARLCSVGGTAGSVATAVGGADFDTGVSQSLIMFECTVPAGTVWGSGNWTVNINVTTAQASVTWTATYVCRLNSSNVNQGTLGSLTGQTTSMATTGVKTHTVNQASLASPSAGDKVYIVCVLTAAANNRTISFTPSSTITAAGYTLSASATAALTVGNAEASGSATFTPLTFTASGSLATGATTLAASGTFAALPPPFPPATVFTLLFPWQDIYEPPTDPVAGGVGGLTTGAAFLEAIGTFEQGSAATAVLTTGPATLVGVGSFGSTPLLTVLHPLLLFLFPEDQEPAATTFTEFTGSAALTTGAATLSASGTFVAPDPISPVLTTALLLMLLPPERDEPATVQPSTASATLSAGPAVLAATGSTAEVTYTGSAALAAGEAVLVGDAIFAGLLYVGTASLQINGADLAGSATHTPPPTRTGTASLSAGAATLAGVSPEITPAPSFLMKAMLPMLLTREEDNLSAVTSLHIAVGNLVAKGATLAGVADSSAPVYTASSNATVGRAVLVGAGVVTPPHYTLSGSLVIGRATFIGSGIFAAQVFSGSAALSAPSADSAGSATRTVPTVTASSALAASASQLSGTAFFAEQVVTATSALVVGETVSAGSATFTVAPRTASAALTVRRASFAGSGTYLGPPRTAAGAMAIGEAVLSGVGVFAPDRFATGTLVVGAVIVTAATVSDQYKGPYRMVEIQTFSPGYKSYSIKAPGMVEVATAGGDEW